jgi:hypothetical protein
VETSDEELNEKIRQHRKKVLYRIIGIITLVALVVAIINLIYAVQKYDDYEVKSTIERESTNITKFKDFSDDILEYSNDGILCVTKNGTLIWNQSYEMASPIVETCEEYLVVYDQGGTQIYILSEEGLQKKIETTSSIQTVALAQQGTIAVLMKENNESGIKLFDKKGNELANGKFYDAKGSIPVDIAISKDATKLAVSMVDVTGKAVSSSVTFYNFGTVGQSAIDNNVGTYSFEGILIPEIEYVSDNRMIALGTNKIIVFEGNQKPEIDREIEITEQVQSFFHNEKYIGLVYDNREQENVWHIQIMDMRGKTVTEWDTEIAYEKIEFLSNNEICITSKTECEIYTRLGTKKFSYTFDKEIYSIIANGKGQNYIFIFKETTEEVRLK